MADSDSPPVWSDPTAPGAQPPTTAFDQAASPVDEAATPPVPPAYPPAFPPAQISPPAQVSPPAVTPPSFAAPGFPPPPAYPPPAYPPPTEFSVGAAPVPPPRPAFSAPDASYTASSYPVTAPPSPQYGGYGGYGVQPAVGHPGFAPAPKTNGMAIAAMVTSIVGLALLPCYGTGAVPGLVGAILGHVARKQIRERQESGGGMALAGVIMGWIATALGVVVVAGIVIFIAWAANQPTTGASYGTGFNAIGLVLASLS